MAREYRSLNLAALRLQLGDEGLPWNQSIIRALEQDGVLIGVPAEKPAARNVAVVYDALAGHLVAHALLARIGSAGLQEWLKEPATVIALEGPLPDRHPLAEDIFRALVGIVPRRLYRQQLWQLVDEPLRTAALRGAADLEGAYLDAATVEELAMLVDQAPGRLRDLLDRLWQTRGSLVHPLNARFLDAALSKMTVANRDLRWSEWLRRHSESLLTDLRRLEKRWHTMKPRSDTDWLRARWVMWTLTSTVRQLRDQATRSLYWFGRGQRGCPIVRRK